MTRRKGTSLATALATVVLSLVTPGVHAQNASVFDSLTARPLTKDSAIDECRRSLVPLIRQANSKRELLKQAQQHEALAKDLCGLATDYEQTELKLVEFIKSNWRICNVPQDLPGKIYLQYDYVQKAKTKLCRWQF